MRTRCNAVVTVSCWVLVLWRRHHSGKLFRGTFLWSLRREGLELRRAMLLTVKGLSLSESEEMDV